MQLLEQPSGSNWVKVNVVSTNQIGWVHQKFIRYQSAPSNIGPTPTPIHTDTPAIDWVTIPGGSSIMGMSEADLALTLAECNQFEGSCQRGWFDQELPQPSVTLANYQISKYEITNQQYNVCVSAGPCEPAGRTISDNNITYNPIFFADNYPVVGVNHRDASNFCQWIGGRLPTEEEWEKAARGIDGRRYPWGNIWDYGANLASGISSAVGSYQSDISPYGVMDMAGNIIEWTSSIVEDKHMLRGGSWHQFPYRGRTTDRGTKLGETFANYDIGFRCVK